MVCTLGQITDLTISELGSDPRRVELLIGDDGEGLPPPKSSFWRTLFGAGRSSKRWQPDRNQPTYELSEAWHAIHLLLTGDPGGGPFPLSFLVTGGQLIGDDLSYGPLRAFRSNEVITLKSALDLLPPDVIGEKYDPDLLNARKIYPAVNWGNQEMKKWICDYYEGLVRFIDQATVQNKGIFVILM